MIRGSSPEAYSSRIGSAESGAVERELWTPLGLRRAPAASRDMRRATSAGSLPARAPYHLGKMCPIWPVPSSKSSYPRGATVEAKRAPRSRFLELLQGHLHGPGCCSSPCLWCKLLHRWSLEFVRRISLTVRQRI